MLAHTRPLINVINGMKLKKDSRYKEKETIKENASLFTRYPIQIETIGDFYFEDVEIMKIKLVKTKTEEKIQESLVRENTSCFGIKELSILEHQPSEKNRF